ncbi:MAG: succinyl-diaminopimelate desuccinylase [Rhodoblastus sp.]
MTASVLDIARALIRCPSVTPAEGGALAYLESLLGAAGFETHRVTFSDTGTPDVENLYARIGDGGPHLTFAGHTDVVPTGDESLWRFPPFSAEVADGRVWGRGACDMKGGIAAFAAAALDYVATRGKPKGTISLLITGDEEGPSINGTVKLLEWAAARGEKFSHAIVGEPTNPNVLGDMIKIGRRGSLNGDIRVVGRQGHSAYPQQADNPVPTLARIVTALSAAPLDEGNAAFDPTRLVVTSFDVGNAARNVIPGEATAKFNVRFNDIWTPETLGARIAEIVAEAAQGADARVVLHPTNSISFRTQRSSFTDLVVAAIEKKTGRTPDLSTTGGTSDARFIANYCPVLEFGLVGKTIHATDENVEIADLEKLADIYGDILERYFA